MENNLALSVQINFCVCYVCNVVVCIIGENSLKLISTICIISKHSLNELMRLLGLVN